jgi:hypothetical protein
MKKKYQAPEVKVVSVRTDMLLGTGSPVKSYSGNAFTGNPTAAPSGTKARARSWDDDWFSWGDDDE